MKINNFHIKNPMTKQVLHFNKNNNSPMHVHKNRSPYELQFLVVFQKNCPKSIFFESFSWAIIHMDFVGFPFRTSI
jgi:hypothetical protein